MSNLRRVRRALGATLSWLIVLAVVLFATVSAAGGLPQVIDRASAAQSSQQAVAPVTPSGVILGPLIKNSSNNSAPGCDDATVPTISSTTSVHICAITARPEGGGGQNLVYVYTVAGILYVGTMQPLGYTECFGAQVWPSRISFTLKVVVNCKDDSDGNGNDRRPVVIDTGVQATPVTDR